LALQTAAHLAVTKLQQQAVQRRDVEGQGLNPRQPIIVEPQGSGPVLVIHDPWITRKAKIEHGGPDTA
jgi:hypothetical protein